MKDELSRDHITKTKPNTFKYGVLDCTIWVFKYVKRVTGLDLFKDMLNRYTNWSGGREVVRKLGHKNVKDFVGKHFKEIPRSFAQRGDLVMYRGALGICQGKFAYFLNKTGVDRIYTLDCRYAWRIEEASHR